jgi:hypothetical protein
VVAVVVAIGFGRGGGMHMQGASLCESAIVAVALASVLAIAVVLVIVSALVIEIVLAFPTGARDGVLVVKTITAMGASIATNAATKTHPRTRGRRSSTIGTDVASTGAKTASRRLVRGASSGSAGAAGASFVSIARENIAELSVVVAMLNGRRRGLGGL